VFAKVPNLDLVTADPTQPGYDILVIDSSQVTREQTYLHTHRAANFSRRK